MNELLIEELEALKIRLQKRADDIGIYLEDRPTTELIQVQLDFCQLLQDFKGRERRGQEFNVKFQALCNRDKRAKEEIIKRENFNTEKSIPDFISEKVQIESAIADLGSKLYFEQIKKEGLI